MINGKCHCGKVTWEADLPPKLVLNCHCNMCRQLSGADYSSWVIFKDSKFRIVQGAENIQKYQATQQFLKAFCKTCGSTVYCVNEEKFPHHTYVARGNISTEIELEINLQVYTVDKAPWVKIDKDVKIFNP